MQISATTPAEMSSPPTPSGGAAIDAQADRGKGSSFGALLESATNRLSATEAAPTEGAARLAGVLTETQEGERREPEADARVGVADSESTLLSGILMALPPQPLLAPSTQAPSTSQGSVAGVQGVPAVGGETRAALSMIPGPAAAPVSGTGGRSSSQIPAVPEDTRTASKSAGVASKAVGVPLVESGPPAAVEGVVPRRRPSGPAMPGAAPPPSGEAEVPGGGAPAGGAGVRLAEAPTPGARVSSGRTPTGDAVARPAGASNSGRPGRGAPVATGGAEVDPAGPALGPDGLGSKNAAIAITSGPGPSVGAVSAGSTPGVATPRNGQAEAAPSAPGAPVRATPGRSSRATASPRPAPVSVAGEPSSGAAAEAPATSIDRAPALATGAPASANAAGMIADRPELRSSLPPSVQESAHAVAGSEIPRRSGTGDGRAVSSGPLPSSGARARGTSLSGGTVIPAGGESPAPAGRSAESSAEPFGVALRGATLDQAGERAENAGVPVAFVPWVERASVPGATSPAGGYAPPAASTAPLEGGEAPTSSFSVNSIESPAPVAPLDRWEPPASVLVDRGDGRGPAAPLDRLDGRTPAAPEEREAAPATVATSARLDVPARGASQEGTGKADLAPSAERAAVSAAPSVAERGLPAAGTGVDSRPEPATLERQGGGREPVRENPAAVGTEGAAGAGQSRPTGDVEGSGALAGSARPAWVAPEALAPSSARQASSPAETNPGAGSLSGVGTAATTEGGPAAELEAAAESVRTAAPGDLVDQLASHATALRASKSSKLRVQLRPESLGALDLRLSLKEGKLSLEILAESPHAREMIEQALPQLRDALAQRSIEVGRVSLGIGGPMEGTMNWAGDPRDPFGARPEGGGAERQTPPGAPPRREGGEQPEGAPTEHPSSRRRGHHLVDYRV